MKKLKNYKVMLGDVAIDKTSINGKSFIAAVFMDDENIKGVFTYPEFQYYSGNIPLNKLSYVKEKVCKNAKYVKGLGNA